MGNIGRPLTKQEIADAAVQRQSRRMELPNKIAMVVIDKICADIIRPGPKPEERECYVVAQELRDMAPDIAQLVLKVIDQEER